MYLYNDRLYWGISIVFPILGHWHQCAAESGMRDEGRPLAIGLQEQVANHRKQHWSKACVVSVTEKVPRRYQV